MQSSKIITEYPSKNECVCVLEIVKKEKSFVKKIIGFSESNKWNLPL